ncbi:MAG TPA: hypothetical protein PKA59_10415 [Chakrabartia sp.]|jgi:hypothetical protein|nr:hypothetical protein [Chakrabartia sp.]
MHRIRNILIILAFWMIPHPAFAQIVATFYSHDFGSEFPHAFVVLKGTPVRGGAVVDTNYGFTAKAVTPAMLMGSVAGKMDTADAKYIAKSHPQFAVTLSDAQYDALMAVVAKWSVKPGSNYNLNSHNCVHFAGEMAQAVGLKVEFPKGLMKKPRSYLQHLISLNPWVKGN